MIFKTQPSQTILPATRPNAQPPFRFSVFETRSSEVKSNWLLRILPCALHNSAVQNLYSYYYYFLHWEKLHFLLFPSDQFSNPVMRTFTFSFLGTPLLSWGLAFNCCPKHFVKTDDQQRWTHSPVHKTWYKSGTFRSEQPLESCITGYYFLFCSLKLPYFHGQIGCCEREHACSEWG